MQHSVVDFATTLLSIKAQIICNHFTDDTLIQISGAMQLSEQDKQMIPQAIALLRDQAAKNFRIEVTSDSMIYQDEQQEKADRMAFLQAVGGFMSQAVPMVQNTPELAPMALEMLKFGVTAFKAGKQLEGIIDETADKLRVMSQQSEGKPKPPPPEVQKIQMQMQIEQAKIQARQSEMQAQAQLEQAKLQGQMQLEKAKQEYQAQENQLKFQLEEQRNQMDREMEMKVAQMKMMTERNTQVLLAHINNGAKIEVARIGSDDSNGEQAYMTEQDMAKSMESPMQPIADAIGSGNQQMAQAIAALVQTINDQHNRPKTVVRGADGKIIGVQ
jgi:hypothetical protein